ncbi:hypothetical protein A2755_01030 [Candidatus Wolfebacteria bacterium RIFCSPHIGHO2_01_FULL_48_22]|uniref:Nucleotide-diphospho-sugar transferase domain-containing protein n=1 Tax=Candidatus Wolfebacteria bacterium RIFCSPHIGHO2_01_FULL_48_22 TaxID=1802555 RepID=A0A1F8DQE3_9BACT|nr:MAG: hypothetical protein A2755_01030 [Candidatus Wolfebacteria bacterium RIFCSPHIGHO2_01_FULL_48_22]
MTKCAVVTIAIGSNKFWTFTHKLMREYADKTNASFVILTEQTERHPILEKFQLGRLLSQYERILYVDGDVLINPMCPNLFEMVPAHLLGAPLEMPPRFRSNKALFAEAMAYYYPNIHFAVGTQEPRFFGAGIMVLSPVHKHLFDPPPKRIQYFNGWLDMPFLNTRATVLETPLYELQNMGCFNPFTERQASQQAMMFHAASWMGGARLPVIKMLHEIWTEKPPQAFASRISFYAYTSLFPHRRFFPTRLRTLARNFFEHA